MSNKEINIGTVESINIENSEKVSKSSKSEMKENTKKNNDTIKDSKPKLNIKIPLPFAKGYITIDLSNMLSNLFKGLVAGAVAIALAKIADILSDKLQNKLQNGSNISQNDIKNSLSNSELQNIINQAILEYNNNLKKIEEENNRKLETSSGDDKVKDVYITSNKDKKTISNKNKYTIDKRNRVDVLDSQLVKERKGTNNTNIKIVKNPNYGSYVD